MQPQYVENTRNQAAISLRSDKEGLAAIQGVVTSSTAPVAKTKKKKKSGAKSLGRVATIGSRDRHRDTRGAKKIFFSSTSNKWDSQNPKVPGICRLEILQA